MSATEQQQVPPPTPENFSQSAEPKSGPAAQDVNKLNKRIQELGELMIESA